jgi:hypothetical protein
VDGGKLVRRRWIKSSLIRRRSIESVVDWRIEFAKFVQILLDGFVRVLVRVGNLSILQIELQAVNDIATERKPRRI